MGPLLGPPSPGIVETLSRSPGLEDVCRIQAAEVEVEADQAPPGDDVPAEISRDHDRLPACRPGVLTVLAKAETEPMSGAAATRGPQENLAPLVIGPPLLTILDPPKPLS
jgi:hypothetical protein